MTLKKLVNGVLVDMTPEEIEANKPSREYLESEIRSQRNDLLRQTDWMALSDVTMPQNVIDYRQALRDITKQQDFPYSVVWPTL